MTRDEALIIARKIAAGVCEMSGCQDSFCCYMREGAYDDHREVRAAFAALTPAEAYRDELLKDIRAKSNVVDIAA